MKNDNLQKNEKKIEHLYVHIPFCKTFCSYCDFYKVAKTDDLVTNYLDFLKNEIKKYKNLDLKLKTVFLGGGTPNYLSIDQLKALVSLIKENFKLVKGYEWTIECNPDLLTKDYVDYLCKSPINRVSLGIQSSNDKVLAKVARMSKKQHAITAINHLRNAKFTNFSFDFIYNLPNQSVVDLLADLAFIKEYKPLHISWYGLILKENTGLSKQNHEIDEEKDYSYFKTINSGLNQLGYKQYEISNYAISTKHQSKHNKSYWENKLFLGLGPSAASYLKDEKGYFLSNNTNELSKQWKQKVKRLSESEHMFQSLMMGLRLKAGINIKENPELLTFYDVPIKKCVKLKELVLTKTHLKASNKHWNNLHDILLRFM